jgi:putative membrane protein
MTRAGSIGLAALLAFAPAASFAQAVSDAQIAAIVVTANQVDIDAGRVAAARASDTAVKTFATLMVTDHTAVNASATELAARLRLVPEDNSTSRALKQGGAAHLATLKGLEGAAFDRAYVAQEVTYHQKVLDALDSVLIPNAKDSELKALLVKVRPAFVAHLEHATQLQASTRHRR